MGIFSFFKKNDKVGKDSAITTNELLGEAAVSSEKEVYTKLSYHPNWDVPKEQQYIFSFLANELQPLKPNQLSLSAISIDEDQMTGDWHVKAFFRSSISQAIELETIELILLDEEGKRIAAQTFDFTELGTIPPESARPWVFTFKRSNINASVIPGEGWQIVFNVHSLRKHKLDLDPTWEDQLTDEQKEALQTLVGRMPKLNSNEVNFTGWQYKVLDDGGLVISLFIRNGNFQQINIEQLPLEVIDSNNKLIAKGSFNLNPALAIEPNSTKPWTFIFPKELVDLKDADLSRWTTRIPN